MTVVTLSILLSLSTFGAQDTEQLLPTKLRVAVVDGIGNFVEGATVTIYDNEEDYLASVSAVASLKTDRKGRVTFKDLKPISYYIQATKEDMKNDGRGVITSPLSEGRINKVNTVIE